MSNFTAITIEGHPMLMGNPILKKEKKFSLEVGSRITQIGRFTNKGKTTSSCRVQKFDPYITYSGTITVNDIQFMAFELPQDGVTGDDNYSEDKIYSLWKIVDVEGSNPELILENLIKKEIRIHKAVFQLTS